MKKYKIQMSNGYKRQDYCGDLSWDEAFDICSAYNWYWEDPDGIIWDLDIVDDIDRFLDMFDIETEADDE